MSRWDEGTLPLALIVFAFIAGLAAGIYVAIYKGFWMGLVTFVGIFGFVGRFAALGENSRDRD